jgi:N-acetylglucosaminyldiphosphoundecaprenol N-acetyl-beta-D-mannosaminyltransferase
MPTVTDKASAIDLLGVPVARLTAAEALHRIESLYEQPTPALVAYVNAHTLNLASRDAGYRAVLNKADIVLNDGSGVAIAARVNGSSFPENLNGSDFNPRIVELAAARGWPVFLLGAGAGVAERAATVLTRRYPGLRIAGTHEGYFPPQQAAEVAEAVRGSGAEVVMVAMGNPLQELWLSRYLDATGARLGIGVGAFFDFTAGVVPRAPAWMNRWGLEWIYRLIREPSRLWRRYLLGNPLFLVRILKNRLSPPR